MALVDALRRVMAAHALIRGGFFDEASINEAVRNAVARIEAGTRLDLREAAA